MPPSGDSGPRRWPSKLSWALYDLANTIFSMNVISLYLPLWVATAFPRGEVWYAMAYSGSMLVVAVLSPALGSLGDRKGHLRVLFALTAAAVALTFFIGVGRSLPAVLLTFAFANIGYQLGLVSYNSLLTSVSDERDRGRTSGLGVALGYVGSFIGMTLVLPFVDPEKFRALPEALRALVRPLTLIDPAAASDVVRANAFIPTAILFGVFAIPIFLFVREGRGRGEGGQPTLAEIVETAKTIIREPNLRAFYISTFLYMDAIHTVYIVMATYGRFVAGLSDAQIVMVMSIALAAAVAGSAIYGLLTDRLPLKVSMYIVLANWIVTLLMAMMAKDLATYLPVAIVAGVGLGGVEVVTRVALLGLIGDREKGRYFGFFNFTGKASSIVGPQLWALSLFLFADLGVTRFRIGVAVLLLLVIAATFTLRTVSFARR
jgi:MFS transporter, UMF1 family